MKRQKMIRNVALIALIITVGVLFTVSGCTKKEKVKNKETNPEQKVVENQIFEGLEFVNVGARDGVIKTVVINNTGYVYEGSKFKIKVMDENGNVLVEEIDEVKDSMETGTTKTIETKTNADLSKAASIEYSIVNE